MTPHLRYFPVCFDYSSNLDICMVTLVPVVVCATVDGDDLVLIFDCLYSTVVLLSYLYDLLRPVIVVHLA